MTGDEETLKFYNAYGVAIDNNPESPYSAVYTWQVVKEALQPGEPPTKVST